MKIKRSRAAFAGTGPELVYRLPVIPPEQAHGKDQRTSSAAIVSNVSRFLRGSAVFPFVAILTLAGCGDDNPFQVIEETEFAASLGIDLATMEELAGGVYIQDVELGTGDEAGEGDIVNVDYIGWLADGTEFNNFADVEFQLVTGPGGVITGFRDGIVGMQVGGTRKMVIPPDQAYGEVGSGTLIPPGAILVFQVTLNAVEPGS